MSEEVKMTRQQRRNADRKRAKFQAVEMRNRVLEHNKLESTKKENRQIVHIPKRKERRSFAFERAKNSES